MITDGYTTLSVARPQMGSHMIGTGIFSKGLGVASDVAGIFGLGKKRRTRKKQTGNGLLSTGLNVGSKVAGFFGLGKKRRTRKKQMGGAVGDYLKKAVQVGHKVIQDNKLISKGARSLLPRTGLSQDTSNKIGNAIESLGYGKKRRTRRK